MDYGVYITKNGGFVYVYSKLPSYCISSSVQELLSTEGTVMAEGNIYYNYLGQCLRVGGLIESQQRLSDWDIVLEPGPVL